jgi:hypothetical protein
MPPPSVEFFIQSPCPEREEWTEECVVCNNISGAPSRHVQTLGLRVNQRLFDVPPDLQSPIPQHRSRNSLPFVNLCEKCRCTYLLILGRNYPHAAVNSFFQEHPQ